MAKIRIDINTTVRNGRSLTFKAPADCANVTGLIVYYPENGATISKNFVFADAHGVDVGSGTISLFAKNAFVKVVLDTDNGKAYVQNADTNAYLEEKLVERLIAPVPTAAENGKFLRVVNGDAVWTTVDNAEGVSF